MGTSILLCDNCAHEGVCFHEMDLRKYCRELEPPKGPFSIDIFCSKRIPPIMLIKQPDLPRGSSDEFIIHKIWPQGEVK